MESEILRRSGLALAFLMVAGMAAAGTDKPWTSKPYTQWDDKDIQLVLSSSPWVQVVTVEQTWKPLSQADLQAIDNNKATAGSVAGVGSGSNGNSAIISAEYSDTGRTRGDDVQYDVFWYSSRTLREATARRAVIHNGQDPQGAEEYVSAPHEDYELLIQGKDMSPFQVKPEEQYAAMAWMQVKGSKEKIGATKVTYTKDDAAPHAVNGAIFSFPRKKADGSPTIPAGIKNVDFYCKVGSSTMRATFDVSKMQDQKGQDL
jgi:hypothetical protein